MRGFSLKTLSLIASLSYASVTEALGTTSRSVGDGCVFGEQQSVAGFEVQAFSYPTSYSSVHNSKFLGYSYTSERFLGRTNGVTNALYTYTDYNYSGSESAPGEWWSSTMGLYIPATNVILEYTGYFRPDQSGIYELDLFRVDDAVMIFVGEGGFECCYNGVSNFGTNQYLMYATWSQDDEYTNSVAQVYLEEGIYYPMRVVYLNAGSIGALNFTMIKPDGTTISDFSNNVFALDGEVEGQCSLTEVSQPTPSITSTTGTVQWNKPFTSTTTTTTNVISDGVSVQKVIEIVESPMDTITIPGVSPTVYTSVVKKTSGSSFIPVSEVVVVSPTASTITAPWSNSFTSTYNLTSVVVSNGSTFSEIVEMVETPEAKLTVPWSGSSTLTTADSITVTSGSSIHVTTGVIVETTEAATTIPWSGSSTLTTTGSITVTSGASFYVTTGKIVKTPGAIITIPWTGSSTLTTTGSFTVTSGTSVYVTTGEIVKTPEAETTGSTTVTSESSIYATTGVIVETPTNSYTAESDGYVTITVECSSSTKYTTTTVCPITAVNGKQTSVTTVTSTIIVIGKVSTSATPAVATLNVASTTKPTATELASATSVTEHVSTYSEGAANRLSYQMTPLVGLLALMFFN